MKVKNFADLEDPGGKRTALCNFRVENQLPVFMNSNPRLEIQNLGETDIIVTYENQKTPPLLLAHFKVVLVISSDFLWICLLDHGIQ